MSDSTLLLLGLGVAGAAMLTPTVVRHIGNRPIGGPTAQANASGFVPGIPVTLAREAGVSLDVYALARCIASEAGGLPALAKTAVAWAVVNEARARKTTASRLLLGREGKFAAQNVGGRYASTARPPTASDLQIAADVLSGRVLDPTNGARRWDSPRAQRALLARGTPGYTKGPEEVAANRRAEGFGPVYLSGTDREQLRFWRKA